MTDELTSIVLRAVERAAQWVRRALESKDHVARIQAEESLDATTADALLKADSTPDKPRRSRRPALIPKLGHELRANRVAVPPTFPTAAAHPKQHRAPSDKE